MDENLRKLIFEVCNDWLSAGRPVTTSIRDALMESTGDRGKYPNALDTLARLALEASNDIFDLVDHLYRQRDFSERTFGPGARTAGVIDHIRKELDEIEAAPGDVSEWIDVVLLALDGAWRAGHSPEAIVAALRAKQEKNERRQWPDWRTAEPGKAIQHVKVGAGGPAHNALAQADAACGVSPGAMGCASGGDTE